MCMQDVQMFDLYNSLFEADFPCCIYMPFTLVLYYFLVYEIPEQAYGKNPTEGYSCRYIGLINQPCLKWFEHSQYTGTSFIETKTAALLHISAE